MYVNMISVIIVILYYMYIIVTPQLALEYK